MMKPSDIAKSVNAHASTLKHNHTLIDIFEGNLVPYIVDDLKNQLSKQSFEQSLHRLSPINLLPKLIDKLTSIYSGGVLREVSEGAPADSDLMSWYVEKMDLNSMMSSANEFFNLCRSTLLYPFVSNGRPKLRVVLNDRFVVTSTDPIDPTTPTQITLLGDKENGVDVYWTWDAENFTISDSRGDTRHDLMMKYNNHEGINPIGRLPFVYINESKSRLVPPMETDTLRMIKLLPIMLSDLNLATMFQCFSIVYGIDIDDKNVVFAPNAFWSLKSDATTDKKPEIGTIKPTVDYDQVLGLIQSQLSIWLATKGIRAGAVGSLTPETFASGISKMIDEMDTYEARQKQVNVFAAAETDLWDLVLNYMHPHWAASGQIDNYAAFSPSAYVTTSYAVQLPMQSRGQIVRDLRDEYASGFTSRRRALIKLNPELTTDEIDALIEEIDEERTIKAPEKPADDTAPVEEKPAEDAAPVEDAPADEKATDEDNAPGK